MIVHNKVVFQKISPTTHVMSVFQEGKVVYREQLSTKEYLKTDLIHVALHIQIYGTLFIPKEEKKVDMEFLAGALQSIYDTDFDLYSFFDQLKLHYKSSKKRFSKDITLEILKKVRMSAIKYFSDYKAVKPGKTLEIIMKK